MMNRLRYLTAVAMTAMFLGHANAAPSDQTIGSQSGIVTPDQATGVLLATQRDWANQAGTGAIVLCAERSFGRCDDWISPAKFVAQKFPKAKYVGFQFLVTQPGISGVSLALYYK